MSFATGRQAERERCCPSTILLIDQHQRGRDDDAGEHADRVGEFARMLDIVADARSRPGTRRRCRRSPRAAARTSAGEEERQQRVPDHFACEITSRSRP